MCMKKITATVFLSAAFFFVFYEAAGAALTPGPGYNRIFYFREGRLARESLFKNPNSIDILSPQAYRIEGSGRVVGGIREDIIQFARANNIKMMPHFINNGDTYKVFLDDPLKQEAAIAQLVAEAKAKGYWGWQSDFESMELPYRDKYSAFISRMYSAFKPHGLVLSVAVIAQISENPADYPSNKWYRPIGVYDYQALNSVTDFITIMSYDDPYSRGPVAQFNWFLEVLRFSMNKIPANKISLGIPLYYWLWDAETGRRVEAGGRQGISNVFNRYRVAVRYSTLHEAPYLSYRKGKRPYTLWYENARSVKKKTDLIKAHKLHGFSAWALGLELQSIFNSVK